MSFISSVASSSLFATTIANTTTSSLRPFANLDLTEQQRTQIRAIFQQAKTQGLSQTQIQQQINAVLTPAQQTTLQNDISQFQSQNSAATGTSSSSASSTSSATSSTQTPPNPFTDPNGPFANLDLSASQQTQIAQIFQNAASQGLSPTQINSQINAILTTSQQSTFKTDLQNLPAPPQGAGAGAAPPANSSSSTSSSSTSSTDDPLDNLTLTTTQQSQIDQVLQEAQAGTITQSEALAQITNLLTPAQQTLLQQDEQTARTQVSGRRSSGGDSTSTLNASLSSSSVATLPNGVTETDIQNQVAAATSVILKQLQAEVGLLG
jgi:Spy/CpxP family protein refolding chaperone